MTDNVTSLEALGLIVNVWDIIIGAAVILTAVILTGYMNHRNLRSDRRATEKAKNVSAISGIYAEVQSIIGFVDPPQTQPMLPLPDDMWRTYKGSIYVLSAEEQRKVAQLYAEVQRANAILEEDLRKLAFRAGYLDERYKQQCVVVKEKATELNALLEEWLNKNS